MVREKLPNAILPTLDNSAIDAIEQMPWNAEALVAELKEASGKLGKRHGGWD